MHTDAHDDVTWLFQATNRMLRCSSVPDLLDIAYDAIRDGLGYDRVGLLLVDDARDALVVHIGTDAQGRKFFPQHRLMPLRPGSFHASLLADPRMQTDGPGFIYLENTAREVPPEAHHGLDGEPGQSVQVALRTPEKVAGLISVDNLTSGRPIMADHAPPLVAFANALAAAIDNLGLLEERARRIESLNAEVYRRVAQVTWLQEAGTRLALLHDLDQVLDAIYACVRDGLGYDRVGIFLLEPRADGRLVEQEVRGTDEQGQPLGVASDAQTLADDAVLAAHSPDLVHLMQGAAYYYCPDRWAVTPPEYRRALTGRMREQLVVALRHDDLLVGFISVDNLLSERPLTEADAPTLVAFAPQAALAISRARLWADHGAARDAAQAAVRWRNDVLAAVSHDLKNPLTAIQGHAQLLAAALPTTIGPEQLPLLTSITRIEHSAHKMARLLNEMLDAARVEAGEPLALTRQPTDLVALARQEAAESSLSRSAGQISVEAALPRLIGEWDAFRLERVLGNLLSNALKYSPNGGEIGVRVYQDGPACAVVEVRDHGQGIPAAALPHVFDRFYRASNAGHGQGTGIGLAVVRQIVEQHGGTVTVESQVGTGTTATVRLPLGAGQAVYGGADALGGLSPAAETATIPCGAR